jgi:sugar (pentulose or hexulose) kinase
MNSLAIDFGTSSVKVEVLDGEQRALESASEPYRYILLPGEGVELDPTAMLAALAAACARIEPALRRSVNVVCYAAFSPSPVFLRADGGLAYPHVITHLDRRSRSESQFIDDTVGRQRFLEITGLYPFVGGAGIMTILWMKKHRPEVLAASEHVGHLTTFLHHWLTGTWMVDLVNASMLGLYNTTTQSGWSEELIEEFSIPRHLLGEIRNPGEAGGSLTRKASQALGVAAGTPVAIGTNDMAAAQVGAGNTYAGAVMDTAGSSDMISVISDRPVIDPHYYLRNAAIPGLWQIYATTAGGFALDWFAEQFCREMPTAEFYGTYLPAVIESNLAGDVTFAPYLTGDRQSLERRSGSWSGLTLSASRDQMLLALLRSMNQVLVDVVERAQQHIAVDSVIKLTGGMCSPAIIELKRSMFPGFEFQLFHNCSIRGSAALAQMNLDAWGTGV